MAFVGLAGIQNSVQHHHHHHSLTLSAATGATADDNNNSNNSSTSGTGGIPQLATFREAEVLGLRYMQEGNYEQALKGKHAATASQRRNLSFFSHFFYTFFVLFHLKQFAKNSFSTRHEIARIG